ncbi:fructosamine kinase [Intrasporangium oryzae NRRL B-24470]|uniref:Fructosamine kinase n=1 Tax=Intrasporangium oryzae NRRL B-24470 TaxID=1386089 RepID=W9G2E7_9MICO|nr:fructosamine kinase family protein [Intrasporangium oryzae]EWT00155.1 fructosamine kinase [Intrasporangium oryzae NRRL B-24470]
MSSPSVRVHRKTWSGAPAGFFAVEAAGLGWLSEATPVGGARCVGVHDVGERHIDLERLEPAAATARAAEELGRALAATHALGADAFGAPPDGWSGDAWIGRQPQSNEPTASWGLFYAEQRVRPFVRRAVEAGHLTAGGARIVERVCDRLAQGDFDDGRPPARIHGDLWSGNVVFTATGGVLIDPAAHGGHGLTDLAMLALFGFPWQSRVEAAYAEAAGLPDGWVGRVALHQLHPLAVHAVSHGPSYGVELVQAAARYA